MMGDEEMHVTLHGKRRFRQRVKLPGKAVRRMAAVAWEKGLRLEDMPSAVRLQMLAAKEKHPGPTTPVLYDRYIFIFDYENRALVTVYPFKGVGRLMRGR